MKRKYLLLCMVVLMCTACGKSDIQESASGNVSSQVETEGTQEKVEQNKESDYLLGVYSNATDYIDFPMGTFYNGKQTEFCTVKLAKEHIINASYYESEEDSIINEKIDGINVGNIDLSSNYVANQGIVVQNGAGDTLWFSVFTSKQRTMEDRKDYAREFKEISNSGHYAIYFKDPAEYSAADLCLSYQINEDVILYVKYNGPAAEDLGLDQLAQNIYNLIEVIE